MTEIAYILLMTLVIFLVIMGMGIIIEDDKRKKKEIESLKKQVDDLKKKLGNKKYHKK